MKKNDDRDNELDQLLGPLKRSSPNDLQTQKWKMAVMGEGPKSSPRYLTYKMKWISQLAAAMFVGVMIGAMAFKNYSESVKSCNLVAQISFDDATFERSHDNLD